MWLVWHMAYARHLEEASIHLSPSSHPGAWSSVFGPLQDLLFGVRSTSRAAGNIQPLRTTTKGSQLSSQLRDRQLGSTVLLSHQALLLHRDQVGRGLPLLAKWLSAIWAGQGLGPSERAIDLLPPPTGWLRQ